jgi:large subunit ribosomal protein L25
MSAAIVEGVVRVGHGKGASRRTRAESLVPAVVYSKAAGAHSIAVEPKSLSKALLGAKRRNQLIELKIKDQSGKVSSHHVLTKEVQIHPVKRHALHVDFHAVDPQQPVAMKIPLETTGKSKAVVAGARLQIVLRTLNVMVKPGEAPEKITFDTTDTEIGVVRAKSVVLPAGCVLTDDPEQPVLSVRRPRGEKAETATAAAATPAPAGKAAPAAAAAAAPAAKKK